MPGSVDEARAQLAYNERFLATSRDAQRRRRAERMIANLRPEIERLEAGSPGSAPPEVAPPPARDNEEFETVWDGARGRAGVSLSSVDREE